MQREFYSSKFLTYTKIIILIVSISGFIGAVNHFGKIKNKKYSNVIIMFDIGFCILSLIGILDSLRIKDEPVIVVTERSIIQRRSLGREREVNFGRIISVDDNKRNSHFFRKIKIKFRKPDNKIGSFSIDLSMIKNPEILIEFLKQKIKFE